MHTRMGVCMYIYTHIMEVCGMGDGQSQSLACTRGLPAERLCAGSACAGPRGEDVV